MADYATYYWAQDLRSGMTDNVPIGGQTRLPTLFLFFGILGGVQVYGVLGLFLGPVLLAIVVAFIRIYQEQFATAET